MSSFLRLLALPLLTISSAALAQVNFQPGYVLPTAGDTLRGEVDYRSAVRTATQCRFRAAANAAVVVYQPEQLVGYGLAPDKHYQTQRLPGSASPKRFLRTLALGPLSLYQLTDAEGKAHYYTRKDTAALQELVQRDTTVTRVSAQTGQEMTTKERQYPLRAVLWSQMTDCPTAQVAVKSLELKESQLMKAVAAYNACLGGPVRYAQPPRVSKVRFSVMGLVNKGQMDIQWIDNKQVNSGWSLGGGVGLDFAPAFLDPKLTMQLLLLYTQHSFTKEYNIPESQMVSGYDGRLSYTLSQNTIQLPATLRYTYPKWAVRPYVQAGPLFSVFTKNKVEGVFSYKTYAGVAETDEASTRLRGYAIGATLGAGIAIPVQNGAFTLEARRDVTDGNRAGTSLVFGYTFGK